MNLTFAATRKVLLERQGLVFVEPTSDKLPDDYIKAVEIELAQLGYALSTRLHERLSHLSLAELTELQRWLCKTLAAHLGADQKHEPLFRKFPKGIPGDTSELWVRKVLCHFLQAAEQPCLFCRRTGTTHVLNPCQHVVCDHCFDGSTYSACPVCEHHIDRSSPFFQPTQAQAQALPAQRVKLELLDLGTSIDAEARALFLGFCERKQALSPADRDAFTALLRDYREGVLPWVPASIPVKENIAIVFGTLFQSCDPNAVLPVARAYLGTATDVLRLIAVYSGADPALQLQVIFKEEPGEQARGWWSKLGSLFGVASPGPTKETTALPVPVHVHRFKVAPLRRPLRRALLALLDGFHADRLVEDMLRHRSYWVWVGEFLHPHEYARRFPNVARAFAIVRKKAPDGTPAPAFQSYHGKLEAAVRSKDAAALADLLRERPGELARRFDHALRIAGDDAGATDRLLTAFTTCVGQMSTPVLLTLRNLLPTRVQPAKVRIYWPKGKAATGVSAPDERAPLSPRVIGPAVHAIEAELLRRFAGKPALADCIVDEALQGIVVPFNERTASRSAVSLPRGSRIPIPAGKTARLFLHWCQPEADGYTTDIDLSIGFYDASWTYVGVCSYYQLQFRDANDATIATSAGDLRDAPFPDGATEFVDLDRDLALEHGIRYAVMVVNNYAGMPFSRLERGFAGLMFRDDVHGQHFDPRTVELKFALQGENGIFLPLVLDLRENTLHWLDAYSKGQFQLNNVESSKGAIAKICPELIEYFGSGVRSSMYELALLHAAARGRRVFLRGAENRVFVRQPGEDRTAFLERLKRGEGAETAAYLPGAAGSPVFAALYKGDLELPQGSVCYALFRERAVNPIAASDLIS